MRSVADGIIHANPLSVEESVAHRVFGLSGVLHPVVVDESESSRSALRIAHQLNLVDLAVARKLVVQLPLVGRITQSEYSDDPRRGRILAPVRHRSRRPRRTPRATPAAAAFFVTGRP